MKKLIYFRVFTLLLFCLVLVSCKKKLTDESTILTLKIFTVSSITNTTAIGNFSIINPNNANITAAGICYSSTNPIPIITNGFVSISGGALSGNYTAFLTNLRENTSYYIRAYLNYNGTIYYSSTVQSFTTTSLPTSLSLANLEANMVNVVGGSFFMGCTNEQDNCESNETPVRQVTLSNYKICRFEVTQKLWLDVMGSNPSYFNGDLQRPVENVSWDYCQIFIATLNQMTGKNYRLPTEAEWEYAAKGGAISPYNFIYSGSNTINDVAWYIDNSIDSTYKVGIKQANALGLFDMSGNVYEWCADWYDANAYSSSIVINPTGPSSGLYRVLRGGSWIASNNRCRVSYRYRNEPSSGNKIHGFRLCHP